MGALNPEWVVVMRSSRDIPCLDLFLRDIGQSERFYPRGVHYGAWSAPVLDMIVVMDMLEQVCVEMAT
jgi:hypothetical protein